MLHCDLRVQWKAASDLRFRTAISEPQTPSFCRISGDLAQSTRKSLAIAIVRFWRAKFGGVNQRSPNPPEFAQPRLSRSDGGDPQREGTILGVFVPIWLVVPRCEATSLGVFDLCHFALLKRGCPNSGGFGAR